MWTAVPLEVRLLCCMLSGKQQSEEHWEAGLGCTLLLNWHEVAVFQNSTAAPALLKLSTCILLPGRDRQ